LLNLNVYWRGAGEQSKTTMSFLSNIIEDGFFEEADSKVYFYPDGKYRFGKIKSYIITSLDERQIVNLFLKKTTIYSLIIIFLLPIIYFGSMPFADLVFGEFGFLFSWIIATSIIFIFVVFYDRKVKKMAKGFEMIIFRRKFTDIKMMNWKMLVLGFILAFIIVFEGYLSRSGAEYLINILK